jgi:hypothetical protein
MFTGPFIQSKMHARDVRCSDCHDVHSIKRIKDGNDLCLQCHRAAIYDTRDHHFHKKVGETGEAHPCCHRRSAVRGGQRRPV